MIEAIIIATFYLMMALFILGIWALVLMVAHDVIRTIAQRLEKL